MDPQAHDIAITLDPHHAAPAGCEHHHLTTDGIQCDAVLSMADIIDVSGLVLLDSDLDVPVQLPCGDEAAQVAAGPAWEMRAELVTAEVAAVLALVAQDYFSRPLFDPSAAGHLPASVSDFVRRRGPQAARERQPSETSRCQIIAFPVRPR
jgi:hypothetical protein